MRQTEFNVASKNNQKFSKKVVILQFISTRGVHVLTSYFISWILCKYGMLNQKIVKRIHLRKKSLVKSFSLLYNCSQPIQMLYVLVSIIQLLKLAAALESLDLIGSTNGFAGKYLMNNWLSQICRSD